MVLYMVLQSLLFLPEVGVDVVFLGEARLGL